MPTLEYPLSKPQSQPCEWCREGKNHYVCSLCGHEIHDRESYHLANEYAAHVRCEHAQSRKDKEGEER
jgi:DNA-directed RNA polymerase subunit RPC12/RpoP